MNNESLIEWIRKIHWTYAILAIKIAMLYTTINSGRYQNEVDSQSRVIGESVEQITNCAYLNLWNSEKEPFNKKNNDAQKKHVFTLSNPLPILRYAFIFLIILYLGKLFYTRTEQ